MRHNHASVAAALQGVCNVDHCDDVMWNTSDFRPSWTQVPEMENRTRRHIMNNFAGNYAYLRADSFLITCLVTDISSRNECVSPLSYREMSYYNYLCTEFLGLVNNNRKTKVLYTDVRYKNFVQRLNPNFFDSFELEL